MVHTAQAREITRNMTEGDSICQILRFAVPLFIGNIFQQVYSLVDTAVVGHCIGDQAISAIGATSSLYVLLITLISSLNNGYAIITAQSFGAQNEDWLRKCVSGTIVLNAAATLLITLLALVLLKPLMVFLNTPDPIFEDAYEYIFIICAGMASTVCYNMFAGILRALGNSRTPLYCLIIACVSNIVLDILFVSGFQMGVAGAAAATVLAQMLSAVLCGLAFFKNYIRYVPGRADFRITKRLLSDLLTTGTAMALMLCVVNLGTLIFQRANNALGEAAITAYATGRRIISIVMQPHGTIAEATSTFVSQNWGAKRYGRIKAALKKVMLIEVAWGIMGCILVFACGGLLAVLITGSEDAQIVADSVLCMRASGPFFPVLGILLCLRTSMQAMGYRRDPVISSGVELGLKIVGAVWLIPKVGFVGSCFTEPGTWVFMTAYLVIAYLLRRKQIYQMV